ncbi:MAG: hypothetical protein CMJ78_18920 [Planctomycetaceae bacterium]|nr:hypothetical protein [Planctomycetaceae bacterium]
MPIKFRCIHCRQFLGISRSKAGNIVDCPTCGRAVRVPQLDGSVDPIPKPAFNMRDSRLVKALDELASIGEIDEDEEHYDFNNLQPETKEPEDFQVSEAPAPVPEPVAVEPPLPPEPAKTQEPPKSPELSLKGEAGVSPAQPTAAPTSDPLAELAAAGSAAKSDAIPATVVQGFGLVPVVVAVATVGVVSFVMGYWVGAKQQASQPSKQAPNPVAQQPNDTEETAPAIQGRITYKTEDGDSRPDRGARVIVLPKSREGQSKLAVAGFRAADSDFDINLARDTLRRLGGDVAFADESGRFEIELSEPGSFHILLISHFRQREDGDAELDPDLQTALAKYFYSPIELVGRLKYEFGQVKFNGTGTEPWDHSF